MSSSNTSTTAQPTDTAVESPEPYDWALSWDGGHWLEKLHSARESIDDIPITMSSFYPSRYISWWTGEQHEQAILYYLGCWKLPDRFQAGETTMWVNPNGRDSVRYSDVAAICDCGAIQYSTDNASRTHSYSQEHTEDCRPQSILQTKIEIWDNRERILRQAAENCMPYMYLCEDRFGVSLESIKQFEEKLNIDYHALREQGYRRRRATFCELNKERDVSQSEIGDAFGMSRETTSQHIRGRRSYFGDK